MIHPVERRLIQKLSPYYFGADQETLESVVGHCLGAERDTGGGRVVYRGDRQRITDVPEAQTISNEDITYSNQAKVELLNVNPELIDKYGAVSRDVAAAMAEGRRLERN